jgi:hypothetical protein
VAGGVEETSSLKKFNACDNAGYRFSSILNAPFDYVINNYISYLNKYNFKIINQ